MADIIQFPIKTKAVSERMTKIKNSVDQISRGFEEKTHDLALFITNAKDVAGTAQDIKLLESRVIVESFDRLNSRKRFLKYKYPVCHVMVMSREILKKDREWIEALAKVNRVFLIQEHKSGRINTGKYHTQEEYEAWKKGRK